MQKSHILDEIRRTAAANGGVALGVARFQQETGVKVADWHGKYWSRWGDAVAEAGFSPNSLRGAYPTDTVLDRFAELCRELGHFPVRGEMKLKRRADPTFPSSNVFERLGSRHQIAVRVAERCRARGDMADVIAMCAERTEPPESAPDDTSEPANGFVYLFKSGRHYKIGKSNAVGRREREVAVQMPEPLTAVHTIRTDDPAGIEAYWHTRFGAKRLNGEWFNLTAADVQAFKRRKFM